MVFEERGVRPALATFAASFERQCSLVGGFHRYGDIEIIKPKEERFLREETLALFQSKLDRWDESIGDAAAIFFDPLGSIARALAADLDVDVRCLWAFS